MKVDLDKSDLITLVCGNSPSYELMETKIIEKCGNYNGSYGTWDWNTSELEKLEDIQLYELHIRMKNQY